MKKKSSSNSLKIILIVIFVSFLLKLISGQYNISLFKSEPKPTIDKGLIDKIKILQNDPEKIKKFDVDFKEHLDKKIKRNK